MPCQLTECSQTQEIQRFGAALVGLYGYHFLWDSLVITPIVDYCIRHKYIEKKSRDKMRESLWKNAAVATFFSFGLYIGHDKDWFMSPRGYFTEWPYVAPEALRWYYMIYLAFWFQSVDFMLNLTNKHYKVKRKDNQEMLIHHFATISLMIFSYWLDFTRIGMCVLMIHDVNDLLLETAKVFIYLRRQTLADVFFGLFAIVWFIVRWYFYASNIVYSVYYHAYELVFVPAMNGKSVGGFSASTWYGLWVGFGGFLSLLQVLHVIWGVFIIKMIVRTLKAGSVEKDIRSDSEYEEDEEEEEVKPVPVVKNETSVNKRRAPRAD